MSAERLIQFLEHRDIHLVLVDVGASGELWEGFQTLLPVADLLRFDPDLRAMQTIASKEGLRRIIINKVVTDSSASEVNFYLTKSPYCSSALRPDFERIRDYPYEDLFEIVGESKLPATTLAQALRDAGLERVDWVKLDTQGTEFRILRSLPRNLLDQLLACDIEASFYAHYVGSDTLPNMHNFMLEEEFWVAGMTPHLRTRVGKDALKSIEQPQPNGFRRRVFQTSMHRSPTTLEMTYARTIRGARKSGLDQDGFIRLFACHYALGAFEYCMEILEALSKLGLPKSDVELLRGIVFEAINQRTRKAILPFVLDRIRAKTESILRKIFD